jgi:hypothetical protein
MTILRRVEMLEAALLQTTDDAEYKLVLLEKGESPEEGIVRSQLKDWPADRLMAIRFVMPMTK